MHWLQNEVAARGNIDVADAERLIVTDSVDDVLGVVEAAEHRRPRAAA